MRGVARGTPGARGAISWALPLLFVLVLAGYSIISFLPGSLGLDSRLVTVPFRALVLLLSLVVIGASISPPQLSRLAPALLPLLLFWCLYVTRMLIDTVFEPVPLKMPPLEYFLYAIGVCLVPMLAFLAATDTRTLDRAFFAVAAALGVACVLALTHHRNLLEVDSGRLHANDYLNPISLGHQGVSLAVLCACAILGRRVRSRPLLAASYGLLIVGLAVVGLAGSRSPAVALVVVAPLVLWACRERGKSLRVAALLGLIMVAVPSIMRQIETLGGQFLDRLVMTPQRVVSLRESRIDLWRDAWGQFLDHPAFGSSLDLPGAAYPHNLIVESFMATGIVGGTAFVVGIAIALALALRMIGRRDERSWIALLFVQFFILAQFSGSLYTSYPLWCTLAAVLACSTARAQSRAPVPLPVRATQRPVTV